MAWFRKTRKPKKIRTKKERNSLPEGLWVRCDGCREIIYSKELDRNQRICPKCEHHFRIGVDQRLELLLDKPGEVLFDRVVPSDPLGFVDSQAYPDRLTRYQKKLNVWDAVTVVLGELEGRKVLVAVMNWNFMGGSMGSVVGERLVRATEVAVDEGCPLIVVSCSGGARMQEGALSLMQMAKVSAGLARLRDRGLPFVSVMTDPTTGGVAASFAMLGDLNIAEPGAQIGFAGPRVIEQTIRETLPEGFQSAEFLLERGFLDFVVSRGEMKQRLAVCLDHLCSARSQGADQKAGKRRSFRAQKPRTAKVRR